MTCLPTRSTLFVALVLVLLLAGCQLAPSNGLTRTDVRSDDVALRAMLAYAQAQSGLDGEARSAQLRELQSAETTPINRMKLAILLGQNRSDADPAQAAATLDKLLADGSPDAAVFHPLARILHGQYVARARQAVTNERLAAENRASHELADGLQKKLDALTDIERSLPAPTSR